MKLKEEKENKLFHKGHAIFYTVVKWECIISEMVSVHHWRKRDFLIVTFINELQVIRGFACEKSHASNSSRSTGVCRVVTSCSDAAVISVDGIVNTDL